MKTNNDSFSELLEALSDTYLGIAYTVVDEFIHVAQLSGVIPLNDDALDLLSSYFDVEDKRRDSVSASAELDSHP